MPRRDRLFLPLLVFALCLAATPGLASRPSPTPVPITGPTAASDPFTCPIGQTVAAASYSWFFPSDDYYYTLADLSWCSCMDGELPLTVHWVLNWPAPCEVNVRAWIVKAINYGGCYIPDTGLDLADPTPSQRLCGPSAIVTLSGSGLTEHTIQLPLCDFPPGTAQCIHEPAFLLFKIVSSTNCPMDGAVLASPGIVVDDSPNPCVSYNHYTYGLPEDLLSLGFTGNTTMWVVQQSCCVTTRVPPTTWGQIKTLYR